ncbi:MAG TPA: MBL fold metallo-hydrolase [Burkholderiales bacterium]|nr:MBL fold metallo-hydrolase [Burkholderiales bacterium]
MFRQLFDPASSTYSYLLADDATHEAVLIDPVLEQVATYLELIGQAGLRLRYTLETHVHADHVTGALALREALEGALERAPAFPFQTAVSADCNAQGFDRHLHDGDVVLFGQEEIMVMATPGHTPGSVCYLWRDRLFTGDTLFIGGCGRTDFQGGSAEQMYRSITEKLFTLDEQVLVYPGHDYKGRRVSSIGEEKLFNARITGKSLEEFVRIMDNLGLPEPKRIHEAVPANLAGGTAWTGSPAQAAPAEPLNMSVEQFAQVWLAPDRPSQARLLDVRTVPEFERAHVPDAECVPLDALNPAALKEFIGVADLVYCICQTGTRSQFAARQLRDAGFTRVVHVDGGTNAWRGAGLPLESGRPFD